MKALKELAIIYDAPASIHSEIVDTHNLNYYLAFFDKIRILYWSKEKKPDIFKKGKMTFYSYKGAYNSGCIAGLKYMFWIAKTLLRIKNISCFMPVIPIWAGIPSLIVGKIRKKKIILRLEAQKIDYLKNEGKLEKNHFTFLRVLIVKIVYYFTLPLYNLVIGISKGVAKEAKEFGARKTIVIPIVININPFLRIKRKNSKVPVILYVGQIKKVKGIDDLVGAFSLLDNAKLLIVGEATNPKDKAFFSQLKKRKDIKLLGHIEHKKLSSIYKKADIFVLPSYTEALGMVIMEAMASELPVIATKTSGAKELIKDKETGFLVPIGDIEALAKKLKMLIDNPRLRKSMGGKGRKRIKEIIKKAKQDNQKLWKP